MKEQRTMTENAYDADIFTLSLKGYVVDIFVRRQSTPSDALKCLMPVEGAENFAHKSVQFKTVRRLGAARASPSEPR